MPGNDREGDETGEEAEPILEVSPDDLDEDDTAQAAAPLPASASVPASMEQPPAGGAVLQEQMWYTYVGGQVYGPYRASDISEWLRSGQISWDALVSRGQAEPWRPVRHVMEFYDPSQPYGGVPTPSVGYQAPAGGKNRILAGVLAIIIGSLGVHHFYLENWWLAILYLVLSCTGVSALLALVEGIIYLVTPEDRFQRNYHNWFCAGP